MKHLVGWLSLVTGSITIGVVSGICIVARANIFGATRFTFFILLSFALIGFGVRILEGNPAIAKFKKVDD